MTDLDAIGRTDDYICEFCGNNTFTVSLTNFQKVAEPQKQFVRPIVDKGEDRLPRTLDVRCAKCLQHCLSTQFNSFVVFEDEDEA